MPIKLFFSLIFVAFIASLTSCEDTGHTVKNASEADSTAIANTVHGFYAWYAKHKDLEKMDFTDTTEAHLKLDEEKFDNYLNAFERSEFVSDEYIEGERVYFARCETIWQTEEKGDLPAGFDANRVYCAQDDVHNELLTSVGVSSKIHSNTVKSEVYASAQIANITFNLKKEKDRWLITKILCDQSIQF